MSFHICDKEVEGNFFIRARGRRKSLVFFNSSLVRQEKLPVMRSFHCCLCLENRTLGVNVCDCCRKIERRDFTRMFIEKFWYARSNQPRELKIYHTPGVYIGVNS